MYEGHPGRAAIEHKGQTHQQGDANTPGVLQGTGHLGQAAGAGLDLALLALLIVSCHRPHGLRRLATSLSRLRRN
jgi:hypothetical protein